MTTIASQITSLTVVYSTVYSDADQRKHQSSASLAFVWGIHRDRWIPHTKGQLRGKCFHLMMSWCYIMTQTTGRWIPLGNDWIFCVVVCPDQRSVGDTWIKLGLSYVTCCLSSVYNLVSMVIVHPGVTRRAMSTKIKHINTVRHFDAYIYVLTCYPNTFQNAVGKLSAPSFKIQYVPVLSKVIYYGIEGILFIWVWQNWYMHDQSAHVTTFCEYAGCYIIVTPTKIYLSHDDVIKWKHFPRCWLFVREIHWSPLISHTKASDAECWCFLWSAPEWTLE